MVAMWHFLRTLFCAGLLRGAFGVRSDLSLRAQVARWVSITRFLIRTRAHDSVSAFD